MSLVTQWNQNRAALLISLTSAIVYHAQFPQERTDDNLPHIDTNTSYPCQTSRYRAFRNGVVRVQEDNFTKNPSAYSNTVKPLF